MLFFQYDNKRISLLADRLVTKIMAEIPDVIMNGDLEHRYSGMAKTQVNCVLAPESSFVDLLFVRVFILSPFEISKNDLNVNQ